MSMVFDRSWPLNGNSDKAEQQDLQYYNVISHESVRFSFLFRCTPLHVIRKVTLGSFEKLKNNLSLVGLQYKALIYCALDDTISVKYWSV